jgi:hypothetical protein
VRAATIQDRSALLLTYYQIKAAIEAHKDSQLIRLRFRNKVEKPTVVAFRASLRRLSVFAVHSCTGTKDNGRSFVKWAKETRCSSIQVSGLTTLKIQGAEFELIGNVYIWW